MKKIKMAKLKKSEAQYIFEDSHFAIDCSCRSKNGEYSGYHLRNANPVTDRIRESYIICSADERFEHTFYMRDMTFDMMLQTAIDSGETEIIIVCNDCGKEFPFSLDSFKDLKEEIFKDD
jgi:hypothetical protein